MAYLFLWLSIAAGVILLDILTSNFLFAWFAVGSFAAMLADGLGLAIGIQTIIFLLVNLITISIGYPIVRKKYKAGAKKVPLMEENYIGKVFTAKEDIERNGRMRLDGIYWGIINYEEKIKKGEKFKIISIEGIKLVIRKEEEI
ncbi:NfeD family protein [Clostridium sp.]|uniref:NfeD family protein n=1 Tax=Clostridium sp. TaxID=1506 RepID=UPI0026352B52|nr:NfeD family protein [Clostridium sp.]